MLMTLFISQTRNNQWTICSRSETVGTLLCLSCLTSSWACWRKQPQSQTGDCSKKPWRPLREAQTSRAPHFPNTPLTQESLSVSLPGNSICLSSTQSQPPNRTNTPCTTVVLVWRGGWEPQIPECNSITSLCERHKRASESVEVRVIQTALCTGARV